MHKSLFSRVFLFLVIGVLLISVSAAAQDTCEVAAAVLTTLISVCGDSAIDASCTVSGDVIPLDEITLTSDGQPQIIRLSGGITLTLINSRVTAYELAETAGVEITNGMGYNVNLRGGAGSNFDVVGIFRFDATLLADGQSADGLWLRVQLEDGTTAWVSTSLVAANPALDSLPFVDQDSSGLLGHAISLMPFDPACANGQAGTFVSAQGESPQRITLNDLPVSLTNGALWMSVGDTGTIFYALAGESTVGAGDSLRTLSPGDVIAPTSQEAPMPFPSLETLEALGITPEVCLIAAAEPVDALAEPAADADVIAALTLGMSYPAQGQTTVDDVLWLSVLDGWIAADSVRTLGACDALPDPNAVSAPVVGDGASAPPEAIMMEYLNARLAGDGGRMVTLSCASWDSQAALQATSFRAMSAELLNVACYTTSESGGTAIVQCDGAIQTTYNGQTRQWEIGAYSMTQEDDAWRVCGEAF